MYKVKRLAIRLERIDLPTCFLIECEGGYEAHTLVLEGKCGGKGGDGNPQGKTIADVSTFPH